MTETTTNLSGVLKRGAAMAAIGMVTAQTAVVIQTIVVGRLLGPVEVGAFTAGTVLMGFLVEATQGALSGALIQRKTELRDAANTAFVATMATALLLGLAALAASPLIAALFHSPRAGLIAAVTSGITILHGLSSVPDALMQRAFQFKRQMIIAPSTAVTFAGVSIVFAVLDYGAWALVIGWYASTTLTVALSWSMAKWRPSREGLSFRVWRELARFSFPMLLDGIAERSRQAFEQVIVGRALGTGALGQYRYAYRIATLPSMAVITVCAHVLFPAFARISDDASRFRAAYLRALGWTCFAAIPVGALLVGLGEPLVVLLLGEKWRLAGIAVAAMAGIGIGAALNSVAGEAMKGAGRSSLLNWTTGLGLALGIPLILLLLPYQLVGVGVALSVTYLVVGIVSIELARKVVGVSRRETLGCVAPATVSALVALAVLLPLEHLVVQAGHRTLPAGLALIVAQTLVFAMVFLGVLRLTSPTWYAAVTSVIGRTLVRAGAMFRSLGPT